MIEIITRKRARPQFLAYDLEWVPHTFELRLVGVFDGERYRHYTTIEDFISSELTAENSGRWFYAHSGGRHDFQFVLHGLLQGRYQVAGSTSGSSLNIAKVKRGEASWMFVDSLWLMRDSLRSIGKWLGMTKGNPNESVEWYRDAPLSELIEYNEQDCRILYLGIETFESIIYELGGELRKTQASCAMNLFRRRFLRDEITTNGHINTWSREAYIASRVEVLARSCDDARYYDINSSFPYAMTSTMPGSFTGSSTKLPALDGVPFLADCEIEVPDCQLPPLPIRLDGRVFFPTGRWRGRFSNADLQALISVGGEIAKVHDAITFEPRDDLAGYVHELYARRQKASGFLKVAYKYLLNSLYGKFGESDIKVETLINPETEQPGWLMVRPGIYLAPKIASVPHMHVPISVHVTSIARKNLYDYMIASGGDVHYCDTDGFSTTGQYPDSSELGGLKLEKLIKRGRFVQPKVYALTGTDADGKPLSTPGDPESDGTLVRAKGFSRMTLSKFERLASGEEIECVRMVSIRENIRSGDMTPKEIVIGKQIRKSSVTKRKFETDGKSSRPWTVNELQNFQRKGKL